MKERGGVGTKREKFGNGKHVHKKQKGVRLKVRTKAEVKQISFFFFLSFSKDTKRNHPIPFFPFFFDRIYFHFSFLEQVHL